MSDFWTRAVDNAFTGLQPRQKCPAIRNLVDDDVVDIVKQRCKNLGVRALGEVISWADWNGSWRNHTGLEMSATQLTVGTAAKRLAGKVQQKRRAAKRSASRAKSGRRESVSTNLKRKRSSERPNSKLEAELQVAKKEALARKETTITFERALLEARKKSKLQESKIKRLCREKDEYAAHYTKATAKLMKLEQADSARAARALKI